MAVEPEAVFHGWRLARRECLPGGTGWSGSHAGATFPKWLEPSLSDAALAHEEGLDRFDYIDNTSDQHQ